MQRAWFALVVLVVGAAAGCRSPVTSTPSRPPSAAAAWHDELDYLEHVIDLWWATRDQHRRLDGLDVHRVFEGARSQLGGCAEIDCYAGVLRDTLCALGDGHLTIQPEWWLPRASFTSGLHLAPAGDAMLVAAPAPQGLSVGDVIDPRELSQLCERPGSTPAQRRLNAARSLSFTTRFGDRQPASRELAFTGPGGERKTWTLRWSADSETDGAPEPCITGKMIDAAHGIAYVHAATFWCDGDAARFETELRAAAAATAGARRVVIDLRDNDGGMDEPAHALASMLVAERIEWMRFRHPRPYGGGRSRSFSKSYVDPSRELTGWQHTDRWLLIGPGCFSTCDTFASALRAVAGVHLVGETTAGGVGNPTPFRLPYSGIVVNIPITLYAAPGRADDVLIEGHGTEPDLHVSAGADDVRAGRDPVLAAALALAPADR